MTSFSVVSTDPLLLNITRWCTFDSSNTFKFYRKTNINNSKQTPAAFSESFNQSPSRVMFLFPRFNKERGCCLLIDAWEDDPFAVKNQTVKAKQFLCIIDKSAKSSAYSKGSKTINKRLKNVDQCGYHKYLSFQIHW